MPVMRTSRFDIESQIYAADTFDVKRKIIVDSEEEIFQVLGVKYVEPTKRSHKYWSKILEPLHIVLDR